MEQQCQKEGCHNVGSRRCSRCKVARYCSKECQTAAWKQHKKQCSSVSTPGDVPTNIVDEIVYAILRKHEDLDDNCDEGHQNDSTMQDSV